MLSKQRIKFIKSLQIKKFRQEHKLFLVQGKKNIQELLKSQFIIETLFLTETLLDEIGDVPIDYELVSQKELDSISSMQTNSGGVAIVQYPREKKKFNLKEWALVLDRIQDPGNLGTIIRIADWYGLKKIICSNDSVDVFNPKVINATMGSFARVEVLYTDLEKYLTDCHIPIYGAFLRGNSVYDIKPASEGLIVLGNESQGISANISSLINQRIMIPRRGEAESLNVAVATGIICDNFFRN